MPSGSFVVYFIAINGKNMLCKVLKLPLPSHVKCRMVVSSVSTHCDHFSRRWEGLNGCDICLHGSEKSEGKVRTALNTVEHNELDTSVLPVHC